MRNVYILVQLLGLVLLFMFPFGTIIGLILLLFGGIMYRKETRKIKEEKELVKCPYCAEKIRPEATLCRFCGKEVKGQDVGKS